MTYSQLVLEAFNLPEDEQFNEWFESAAINLIPPKEWITKLKRVIYEADTPYADEDGNILYEVDDDGNQAEVISATSDELEMFNEYEHEREGYLSAYLRKLSPFEAYEEAREFDN